MNLGNHQFQGVGNAQVGNVQHGHNGNGNQVNEHGNGNPPFHGNAIYGIPQQRNPQFQQQGNPQFPPFNNYIPQPIQPQFNPQFQPYQQPYNLQYQQAYNPYFQPPQPPQRTLQQMNQVDVGQNPLGINYPVFGRAIELKSNKIYNLPKFHGLDNEDPQLHMRKFHLICDAMKPEAANVETFKMTAFPLSLEDKAQQWLIFLPPGSINSWTEMARAFLDKYNPATRISNLRQQICSIQQQEDERFHTYWERFNNLVARCPQHQIPDNLLLTHFYEGLLEPQRNLVDATSNGSIFNKNPDEIRQILNTMATNSQNFGGKASVKKETIKNVGEVSNIEAKIYDLSKIMSQAFLGGVQPRPQVVCGVCSVMGHVTTQCPLIIGEQESVNAMGGYQGQPSYQKPQGFQQNNNHNPTWKNNNNYPQKQFQQNPQQPSYYQQPPQVPQQPPLNYNQGHQSK